MKYQNNQDIIDVEFITDSATQEKNKSDSSFISQIQNERYYQSSNQSQKNAYNPFKFDGKNLIKLKKLNLMTIILLSPFILFFIFTILAFFVVFSLFFLPKIYKIFRNQKTFFSNKNAVFKKFY